MSGRYLLVVILVLGAAFLAETGMAVSLKNETVEALRLAHLWQAAAQTCPLYQTRAIPPWIDHARFRSASV